MKYPIGIQSFDQIIEDGYVYIDKTDLVYRLATEGKIYFLSRPRRFGKSLLVSTLKNYFLGRKELFKGLKIDALEKDWKVKNYTRWNPKRLQQIWATVLSGCFAPLMSRVAAVPWCLSMNTTNPCSMCWTWTRIWRKNTATF